MSLVTENLCLTYPNQKKSVLNDITISFEENKIHLLLGPSGCGKSSFVNILTGIIPNNINGKIEGDIIIQGESIRGKESYELSTKIGYVMQDADTQFCTYKVEDELIFGLENLKFPREEMDKRIEEVLNILDIEDLRYKVLNSLSGGQKQKVAIASILILDPPIIIFDEPTANLDPLSSREVFAIINRLKEEFNKTIIIIEHKLDNLIEYVDYVHIFSQEGGVVGKGRPEDIFKDMDSSGTSTKIHFPSLVQIWKGLKLPFEDIKFDIDEVSKYLNDKFIYRPSNPEDISRSKKEQLLNAQNVSYSVDNYQIIDDLSFHVDRGDFLAVIGPNGAGKSTIAGILLNLYKDFQGDVSIDGKSVKKLNRKDLWKKAGIVFQNPEWQFISYTVREELEYSLKDSNLSQEEMDDRIDNYLDRFSLLEFKESNPYLLSQGQKRRLSVASMMVTGQEILILDEPTYGQDYQNQIELLEYMAELNATGMTIIMISHDMESVIKYCNKVLILKEGRSIYYGNSKDLFHKDEILERANLLKPLHMELAEKMNNRSQVYSNSLEEFILNLSEIERGVE